MKVGIEIRNNHYWLRLPAALAKMINTTRYIGTKLVVDPDNLQKVRKVAKGIEKDIREGYLDTTLERYREQFRYKYTPASVDISLIELWERYCEFKSNQVAITTYTLELTKTYHNHIASLPTQNLKDAIRIRDYLVAKLTPDVAKRVIQCISICCEWGVTSGIISHNPFAGMSKFLKKHKDSLDIDPFSAQERYTITKAFQEHKNYTHYAPFVKFLFLTGCRIGEAIALEWSCVAADNTSIIFQDTYSSRLKLRKPTKNGKTRRFPCNETLRALLAGIRPTATAKGLVFPSLRGLYINNIAFTRNVWKPFLGQLVKERLVSRYRPPYNTRHTFITMALEAGISVQQVAKWVGNTPSIIYRYYAGVSTKVEVPIM